MIAAVCLLVGASVGVLAQDPSQTDGDQCPGPQNVVAA